MEKGLRIIFIGTPEFAVESLRCVHESGRNVVAVITAPDRKAGRGQKLKSSAVKEYALNHQIPILQPTNLKSPEFISSLQDLKADIQIVVAFRMMPEVVWNMPRLGTFNLHASLLPNYRGAAPINWAIINGEKETGVTTFFLKHKIDTGDLLLQESVKILANETAGSLHDKLMTVGGQLVLKSLDQIEAGDYQLTQQKSLLTDSDELKDAPKIFKADCEINWNKTALEIDQQIRGLSPFPAAWTTLKHLETEKQLNLKILKTSTLVGQFSTITGEIIVKDKKIHINCGIGILIIEELQLEGKRRMSAMEALNGFNFANYKIQLK